MHAFPAPHNPAPDLRPPRAAQVLETCTHLRSHVHANHIPDLLLRNVAVRLAAHSDVNPKDRNESSLEVAGALLTAPCESLASFRREQSEGKGKKEEEKKEGGRRKKKTEEQLSAEPPLIHDNTHAEPKHTRSLVLTPFRSPPLSPHVFQGSAVC